jgi:hypothetical protein
VKPIVLPTEKEATCFMGACCNETGSRLSEPARPRRAHATNWRGIGRRRAHKRRSLRGSGSNTPLIMLTGVAHVPVVAIDISAGRNTLAHSACKPEAQLAEVDALASGKPIDDTSGPPASNSSKSTHATPVTNSGSTTEIRTPPVADFTDLHTVPQRSRRGCSRHARGLHRWSCSNPRW